MKIMQCIFLFFIGTMLTGTAVAADTQGEDRRGTVSVTGAATDNYPPDTAVLVLAIENTSATVSQATHKNNVISERVISGIKKLLKPDAGDEIKTSSYSLEPVHEYDQVTRKNKFLGYRAVNQITVRTKQISNVGGFIDSAVEQGINRVDNISFSLSDTKGSCKSLLQRATEQARSDADVVAQSLGTRIAGVKDISASCGGETPRPLYRFGMAAQEALDAGSQTPVEAGTLMLQGTVRAVFYIDAQ
ncbi:MAG: SIMPL domain-containing protein [Nitrospirae bacterium]|nr:SIMPL domain-containing protein [Nitrospirota bacterium]